MNKYSRIGLAIAMLGIVIMAGLMSSTATVL